jgi:hypothetical protein
MSTFSPNLDFELVARNADVGVWDAPTNNNWGIVDNVVGNIATIPVNNSNIVLSLAQIQSKTLTFNSTLSGSITVSFASTFASFAKSYEIRNIATGSLANTITLATTVAGGQVVCAPPGESVTVVNDGTNIYFHDLGRIGGYWDYAGSSVPAWVSGCTVPPYLPCTGASFSSATYPVLAMILGQTTTPDRRGTVAANLDQGAGRLTTISSIFTVGGDQNLQSHTHNVSGNTGAESGDHNHNTGSQLAVGGGALLVLAPTGTLQLTSAELETHTHGFNVTSASAGTGAGQNLPPTTIVGITMIRAA